MNVPALLTLSAAVSSMTIQVSAEDLRSSRRWVTYHTVEIQGLNIFYREGGPANAPTVLLLHGFPSSSRTWEPLLALLADKYHLVAPDDPGFGNSSAPSPSDLMYAFDNLAGVIGELTTKLGLTNYVLFVQDYGGPVGFRMALTPPERVRAMIIQNAVSHEQGLSPLWNARKKYWADPSHELEALKANFTSFEATRQRHIGTSPHPERYDPDTWTDEFAFLSRPGQADIRPCCSWTTGPMSPPIQGGRNGCAKSGRQCWWFGGNTTRPSRSPAQKPIPTMCLEQRSTYSKPVIFALDEATDDIALLVRGFLERLDRHAG